MLYVTMQPRPGLSPEQFHEWYNNEHGPTRLRIGPIFTNGLRYKAADSREPAFLAAYDVTDMSLLTTATYTSLRENRSPREAETIGQVEVKRFFLDLVSTAQSPLFLPIEQLTDEEADGIVLVLVEITLREGEGVEAAVAKWFKEEHVPMLAKVPGWLRTRLFRTSTLENSSIVKLVALHEYAKQNGLGGPEHHDAQSTAWREEVFSKYIADRGRRTYSLFYVFGPAPRELSNLSRLPPSKGFTSPDGKTITTPGQLAAIDSYVTTVDGLVMPFRLEGNSDPAAPTIAFCNSLLTSLHMWDPFVEILKSHRPDFRILRYDMRGRHGIPSPPVPATLDILADDLSYLLDALRIPQLQVLVGVSMGGATTLKFAIKYPEKLAKFVACDFNVASGEANTKAWKDRIGVAESKPDDGSSGIRKLAGVTVERWFHPHTMTEKHDVAQWIADMVAANNVEGFKYGCQALWGYDLKGSMGSCRVPGLLVVGDGDGKGALVKAMDGFKGLLGDAGADLKVVPQAGHLPMCESPVEFWEAVQGFL